MPLLLIALAATAGLLFLYSRRSEAAMNQTENADPFEVAALKYGLDADLLRAIAYVESSNDPGAVHWNPPNDVSVGEMQILCKPPAGTQRGEDFVCQNRFDIPGWPLRFSELKDRAVNIDIGARILSYNMKGYGFPRGVAVYNDYRARFAGVAGPFPNDSYVTKVINRYSHLKGIAA
jgi:soluble lytic murein transglycosylase-like protein